MPFLVPEIFNRKCKDIKHDTEYDDNQYELKVQFWTQLSTYMFLPWRIYTEVKKDILTANFQH